MKKRISGHGLMPECWAIGCRYLQALRPFGGPLEDFEGLVEKYTKILCDGLWWRIIDYKYTRVYIYIIIYTYIRWIYFDMRWTNITPSDFIWCIDSSILSWLSLFFVFSRAWNIFPTAEGIWFSLHWHDMQHEMLCQRLLGHWYPVQGLISGSFLVYDWPWWTAF